MPTPTPTARQKDRAILVGVEFRGEVESELNVQLRELKELVENVDYEVVDTVIPHIKEIHPAYYIGAGKAEEIIALAKAKGANTIICNEELSPSQQRNWETAGGIRTIDRQEVILEIFEARAQTKEAVLQVQLARLEYMLPRLKRAWTHLERQHGGSTGGRGVGETQLELDSRMVRDKIALVKTDLEAVRTRRGVQRKTRERVPLIMAAIVGYTNSGKSTLLNKLTGATVLAENKLFATLDPTTRKLTLPSGQKILLTDTVGFIRKLPHSLVEAFKATLEETVLADFLIHVVDVSDSEKDAQRRTTLEVLKEIGAADKRIITVFNKVDKLANGEGMGEPPFDASASLPCSGSPTSVHGDKGGENQKSGLSSSKYKDGAGIAISATTGEGIEALLSRMDKMMDAATLPIDLLIPHSRYDIVNLVHEAGGVTSQKPKEEGVAIKGRVTQKVWEMVKEFAVGKTNLKG